MSQVSTLTEESFEEIRKEPGPVLLDFYADWCGPCRALAPVLDRFASENAEIVVRKINVDKNPRIAAEFGVRSIPTLVVLKDGREAARQAGAIGQSEIDSLRPVPVFP